MVDSFPTFLYGWEKSQRHYKEAASAAVDTLPTRKLTNSQIMAARSKGRYNPGGHRGRSGMNGAGNYRKTPEEKAQTEADNAIIAARKSKETREARALAKFEKNYQKVLDKINADDNTRPLGSWIMRMRQHNWNQKALKFACDACGGRFELMPKDILKTEAKHLCPDCSRKSHGKPRADARLKFEMRCDEQGLDLVWFASMGDKCDVQDRRTGETRSIWPKHIDRWGCVPHDDRIIRFVADDDDRVFVWRGRPPMVKHPYIAHMLATNPIETLQPEKPLKSAAAMATFIKQCQLEGDYVVNLSLNKTWLEKAQYTWGEIPTSAALGKYFEDMRANWD